MNPDFAKLVFNGVWVARLVVGAILSVPVVWFVSFHVADYVVQANVAAMQAELSRINNTDLANTDRIIEELRLIRVEITSLREQSATQISEISFIRDDLDKIQVAVQDFGINIPAVGQVPGGIVINTSRWTEIQAMFGIEGDAPVFLEVLKPSSEQFH